MLDDIFGYKNFRNEIVWCYSLGGRSKKIFPRKHDIIFFYTKSNNWKFNYDDERVRIPRKPDSHMKVIVDERGIRWQEKTDSKTGKIYRYPLTKLPEDWWIDIEQLNREDAERLGYPTQKPESLLERIIRISSNKEDIIFDPFCGCGTAMAVAQQLGRNWIGIDISPIAISLIENRLARLGANKSKDYDVIGMPTTLSELKALEHFEFQNWVINEMRAKQSKKLVKDMGINGYYEKTIFTDEAGIQVKQSEKVGRNVVDNFETSLRRRNYEKGYIVAFSFTKDAHEEAARVKGKGLDIQLIKLEDLLYGRAKV